MKAKVIVVAKAQPNTVGATPDTYIEITGELPDFASLEEWDAYADRQAKQISDALGIALPGGVYDRLLGRMLTHKASHFRVAHKEVE